MRVRDADLDGFELANKIAVVADACSSLRFTLLYLGDLGELDVFLYPL